MARHAAFKVASTPRGWKVEIPTRFSDSGKRERMYFKTRDEAKAFATKSREDRDSHGANASPIRPALAEEANRAAEILEPYGISILDAAKRIAQEEEAKLGSKLVEAALAAFLLAKETKSDSQQRSYDHMRTPFEAEFSGRKLSTITAAELIAHVENNTRTDSTFNRRSETLRTFWRWCARPPRGWCQRDVIDVLETRQTGSGEIGVLRPAECQLLLEAAEANYPECVAAFAISLFTGLRKAELERLEANDVTDGGITLPAPSAKTGRRRFIEMPKPLRAWLKAYPISDTVLPANWVRKDKAIRRLSGWRVWCDLVIPAEPDESLPEWPDNALRHTHASVMVALGKPMESLTFEFGHSGGASVLKSHYVGVMSKAEAGKIWSLGPKGTTIALPRNLK